MTPSPCLPARRRAAGRGGPTDPPGRGSSRATRSRRRSCRPGGTCPGCATRTGSTPGCTDYRHSCIDAARRRRRRVIEVELTPVDGPSVGDASALGSTDRDLLDRALAGLEPEARAPVVLHYYLGIRVPDAADALGIPLGTAKSRLRRSLAQMRATSNRRTARRPRPSRRATRMTPIDRFERQLPDRLAELAGARTPDYFDDLLAQTARTRQRPAWTFLERWLPMDLATPRAATARIPWRPIARGRR